MTNLDVHVWRDRDGRYRARCTGTVNGEQAVVRACPAPNRNEPGDAAEVAVKGWLALHGRAT